MPTAAIQGVVDSFSEREGFGRVRRNTETWFFHCTQISGGARTIAVGTPVSFTIVPGRLGQWEASDVTARENTQMNSLGPFPRGGSRDSDPRRSGDGDAADRGSEAFPNGGNRDGQSDWNNADSVDYSTDDSTGDRSPDAVNSGPFPRGGQRADAGSGARRGVFPCPVCEASVEGEPRDYEICAACGWEDDPVQFDDPTYAGGANAQSLEEARRLFTRRNHRDRGH